MLICGDGTSDRLEPGYNWKEHFFQDGKLEHLVYVTNLVEVGDNAFMDDISLTDVSLKSTVTLLGKNAFAGSNVSNIFIPASVKLIGENCFYNCSMLTDITLPKNVRVIENSAFERCFSLQNVLISNKVITLGDACFKDCKYLTKIVIPDSVLEMREQVFSGCDSLTDIALSNNLSIIGKNCFVNTNIRSIRIPSKIKSIPALFFAHNMHLQMLYYSPDTLGSIGDSAFYDCPKLNHVVIHNVGSIGVGAFTNCVKLNSITMSSSLSVIDMSAFSGCSSLNLVIFKSINPPSVELNAFENIGANPICLVPKGTVKAYTTALKNSGAKFNIKELS